jgi:hypothetical protein
MAATGFDLPGTRELRVMRANCGEIHVARKKKAGTSPAIQVSKPSGRL